MSGLHLICDESTEPINCSYFPFPCCLRVESATTVRLSYGYTDSAASTILSKKVIHIFQIVSLYPVNISFQHCTSPHGHLSEAARRPCNKRTIFGQLVAKREHVEILMRLYDDSINMYDVRAISAQPPYGFVQISLSIIHTKLAR